MHVSCRILITKPITIVNEINSNELYRVQNFYSNQVPNLSVSIYCYLLVYMIMFNTTYTKVIRNQAVFDIYGGLRAQILTIRRV